MANCDVLMQAHQVCSKQSYFSVSGSLFAPSLLQRPISMLNAYLKKSLPQPIFVVPTSHVLKWRLSKKLDETRVLLMEIG